MINVVFQNHNMYKLFYFANSFFMPYYFTNILIKKNIIIRKKKSLVLKARIILEIKKHYSTNETDAFIILHYNYDVFGYIDV